MSLSLILGNHSESFSGNSFTCKVYSGSHLKVTVDITPKTPRETFTAFIISSSSLIVLTDPSAKIKLQLVIYSHNNLPLVPCVPVAKAPPMVIVLMSGKQGMHQFLASIASSKSPRMIPD